MWSFPGDATPPACMHERFLGRAGRFDRATEFGRVFVLVDFGALLGHLCFRVHRCQRVALLDREVVPVLSSDQDLLYELYSSHQW